jgi:photosystem II stability/assembly factor-like uncharacterized protein
MGELGLVSSAYAQHWQAIGQFVNLTYPYFLNENFGFVFGAGGTSPFFDIIPSQIHSVLYRTRDGGVTWTKLNADMMGDMICSLYFVSSLHGYAGVVSSSGPKGYSDPKAGIFETQDGGDTWHRISPEGYSFMGVYAHDNLIVGTPGEYGPGVQGLQGVITSHDGGATWKWETNALSYSAMVSGNLDDVVTTGGWGVQRPTVLSVTSDSAKSWSMVQDVRDPVLFELWGIYNPVHSHTIYQAHEEAYATRHTSPGVLYRSSDLGKSWTTPIMDPNIGLSGQIGGAGCVVYAQHEVVDVDRGFLRSTDDGLTWRDVGGPNFAPDCPRTFSVVGNGAIVYAMDLSGTLWKTTDGGDGTLSANIPFQVSFSHTLSSPSKDTLYMSECDSTTFQTTFAYAACDHARLDSVRIDGLNRAAYQSVFHYVGHKPDEHDTAVTTIRGLTTGRYPLTVHAIYRHDDQLTNDTTYQFTLVVKQSPAILSITRKDTIDFGPQALCAAKLVKDSLSIRNLGCESLQVDSVWMVADQATNDFSFIGGGSLTLIRNDSAKLFRYSFKPSQAIKESARIFIKTSLGIDTIYLKGEGTADQKRVALSVDTVRSSVCDSVDAILTIANTSCRLMAIDSLLLPPPVYVLPGQLPLGLGSGSSQDIRIRFVPSVAGQATIQFKAVLRVIVGSVTTRYDTLLTLPITAKAGTPAITALDTIIDLGKISTCATSDATIHFASTGCDTLRVSGEQINGSTNGFSITDAHKSSLAVQQLDSVRVHFAPPSVGSFATDIIIVTAAGNKTVHLKAEGIPDSGRIALSSTALDLGSVTAVCDSSASSFVFKNTTCNPITVDSLSSASRPFVSEIISARSLATDSSLRLNVSFLPAQPGQFASSIRVYYHGPDKIEHDTLIKLQGIGLPSVTLGTELQAATLSTQAGQPSSVPVYIIGALDQSSAKSLGLRSVDLTLAWNTDLLSPIGVVSPIIGASISKFNATKTSVTFTVTFPAGFTFGTPTEIATINCIAFVTDTMTTDAEVVTSVFHAAGSCLTVASSTGNVKFTLAPLCSDPTLTSYLAHGLPFAIKSIIPNPTSGKLTIEISGLKQLHYDLFDILGHQLLSGEITNQLDLHSVANGIYYLRLNANGYAITKKIVKQ